MFDPNQFLEQTFTEANDTVRIPCPSGEFQAEIASAVVNPWASKKNPENAGLKLDLQWRIHDQGVIEATNRSDVTVKQSIMLDLTETGGLDMRPGKNIGLGRLRAAVGANTPGQPFSMNMLVGRMAIAQVTHRIDGENIYDEVKACRAM